MPIDRSKLHDVSRRVEELGYDAAVFAFEYDPHDGRPHRVAEVLVANTENAQQKRYDAEDDTTWRSQFIHDLEAGVFGPPPKGVPFANANRQFGQH